MTNLMHLCLTAATSLDTASNEHDESRIIDALATAFLALQLEVVLVGIANVKQPEVKLDGIDDAKVLSVIRQLSIRSAGNLVLQNAFSLAVLFLSERTFTAQPTRYSADRMQFISKRRRPKGMPIKLLPPVTFTGNLSPLFNFVEHHNNPRNTELS